MKQAHIVVDAGLGKCKTENLARPNRLVYGLDARWQRDIVRVQRTRPVRRNRVEDRVDILPFHRIADAQPDFEGHKIHAVDHVDHDGPSIAVHLGFQV